jgi:hypothetical protein
VKSTNLKPEIRTPIQVLAPNIIHSFENVDPIAIKILSELVKSGLINNEIEIDYFGNKFQPPQVTENGLIKLNSVYLEHLWSFIYSTLVIFEEGIQKPQINKTFDGTIEFTTPLMTRARELYIWSLSLSKKITEWNMNLPNPVNYMNDQALKNKCLDLFLIEKNYAEKTNKLFQEAVTFLMYHEFAHIYLNHINAYKKIKLIPGNHLTSNEYSELIQMENDADRFAADMVLKKSFGENSLFVSCIPVLMVLCSSIQILSNPINIEQLSHPNLDNRLLNMIQNFELSAEKNVFYIKQYACFCITQFIKFYDHAIQLKQDNLRLKGEAYSSEADNMEDDKVKYQLSTYDTIDDSLTALLEKLEVFITKQKIKNRQSSD